MAGKAVDCPGVFISDDTYRDCVLPSHPSAMHWNRCSTALVIEKGGSQEDTLEHLHEVLQDTTVLRLL